MKRVFIPLQGQSSKRYSNVDPHTCSNTLSTQRPVRIIPNHAGFVQLAKLRKQSEIHEGGGDSVLSIQEYMKKVVQDAGDDEDFKSGSWVSATDYVNANGVIVSGCLGDIKKFLNKGKLDQVVAIVKSCSPNVIGELTVTVKDLSVSLLNHQYITLTLQRETWLRFSIRIRFLEVEVAVVKCNVLT
nr:hypothetical protein [Tanacetum cinerariifolium]